MGIVSLAPKPGTSKRQPRHPVYPYLLRGLTIDRPNQVWSTDITYVPMQKWIHVPDRYYGLGHQESPVLATVQHS